MTVEKKLKHGYCLECKKYFTKNRPHQRFCSNTCRYVWNNAERNALVELGRKKRKEKCKPS
jgi:hypothetical protein